jgi:hypothetical protein
MSRGRLAEADPLGKQRCGESRIQNSEFRIQNPEARSQKPEARIQNEPPEGAEIL